MKADQYSKTASIKIKARYDYKCDKCGSVVAIQSHAPNGDHSDWRKGIALCGGCHAGEHPDLPRRLFTNKMQQPYWPNVSARALASEFGCHNRTIIRAAKELSVPSGEPLSDKDRERIRRRVAARMSETRRAEAAARWAGVVVQGGEGLLKVKAVAEKLGARPKAVYKLIKEKKLKAVNIAPGSKLPIYRIEEQELRDFIERSRTE